MLPKTVWFYATNIHKARKLLKQPAKAKKYQKLVSRKMEAEN